MLRLLSIQPVAERGGSDQGLVQMLRDLPRDDFLCHVVVPEEPAMRRELEAAGARIHVLPMRRITTGAGLGYWVGYAVSWPVVVWRLWRSVRRLGIDVVHTNSLHSWYGWAAASLARRPHVWVAREIVVQSRSALLVERFLTRHFATVVVSMSGAIAAQLNPRDGRVFTDGVDLERFSPRRAGLFRSRHGIADGVVVVGSAGRIDVWKGFDVLLDAWNVVMHRRPDDLPPAQLLIAGPSVPGKEAYERALRSRAAAMPNVSWLGEVDDVGAFDADLDVFVLASTQPEPFGLAMVEALACGVPVIATDHGGPVEVIGGRPDRGRLVAPGDADALAAAIEEFTDPARTHEVPSDTETRRARSSRFDADPPPWAALFDEVGRRRPRSPAPP